jgi:D-glycero-alpha-D-manno-heptose-7-phosphate kinase
MIISRTPLRASMIGGGTDYPSWYIEHGGAVISTTIDKYCYVAWHNGKVTKWFDLPERAGLGTSSAFTVGLLRLCTESNYDQKILAQLATIWEQDKLGGNVGVQDQYICSVGGFRLLRFSESGVRDFKFDDIDWLNPYLMLFNTHQYRMAGKVVSNQLKEMKRHTQSYLKMVELVDAGKNALDKRDFEGFGSLLGEAWSLKKQLSKYISTPTTDEIYTKAISSGAIGGKLLGAGGGGFMLFVAPLDKQEQIKRELINCEYVPFKFDTTGTQTVFKDKI